MSDYLVATVAPFALAFVMLTLGLDLQPRDFTRLATSPKAMIVGLANQIFLLPLVALVICLVFRLPPVQSVGILILALCPGGALSNALTYYAGGNTPLSVSLTAIASIASFITVPLFSKAAVFWFMGAEINQFNAARISVQILFMAVIPVMVGVSLGTYYPTAASRLRALASKLALVLLLLLIGTVIGMNLDFLAEFGPALALPLMTLAGCMILFGLGSAKLLNLTPKDGTAIAIESGLQNAVMAITIAVILESQVPVTDSSDFNYQYPAAIYGALIYLVAVPFVFLRRWLHGRSGKCLME